METNLAEIREELFCLNFELKAISDLLIYGKAERWVHGFMTPSVEHEHLDRYNFILKHVQNKKVLDIACGCGYGTYLISKNGNANSVLGVDIDESSIRYGNHRYYNEKVIRQVNNALEFPSKDKFDIIVSFETIEHISEYEKLINKFYELLDTNGLLFISTPISKITTTKPGNKYHEIEWSFSDFHYLFVKKFKINEIYLQNIKINKYKLNYIHRAVNFLYRKITNKNYFLNIETGKSFEKYNNNYEMKNCESGYQMLVLSKK
jgi:2-polyprenyl-3-methyl-5-hydroxy-6-metoxy-1,4-benzoquinol methylase